jgi:hypothetical protein
VRGRRTAVALLLAAGLAGCGSSSDNAPALTSRQAQGLVAQLELARTKAAAHDVAGTKAALDAFRASVVRLRRQGALSDDAARALRIGAARVLARVKSDNPPSTPTAPAPAATQTTPTPAPAPAPPPKQKQKQAQEHKHGKGHGKKHGGEGD